MLPELRLPTTFKDSDSIHLAIRTALLMMNTCSTRSAFLWKGLLLGGCLLGIVGCDQGIPPQGTYDADGNKQGKWTYFYKNGQREREGSFLQGVEEGEWVYWYPNGQRKQAGQFETGLRQGNWTFWYENGQKFKEGKFQRDRQVGKWNFWHENGQRARSGVYQDGAEYGEWLAWSEDGKPYSQLYAGQGRSDLAPLIQKLQTGPLASRRQAVSEIAEVGKRAVPELVSLLRDSDQVARMLAAETLAEIGDESSLAAGDLVRAFSDRSPEVREAASDALVAIGMPSIEYLERTLDSNNPEVRLLSAATLGKMGEIAASALPALSNNLKDRTPAVRRGAALAMGAIGPKSIPFLQKAVRDDLPEVRILAIEGLTGIRSPDHQAEVVGLMIPALFDSVSKVRDQASHSLSRIGEPAIDSLIRVFYSDEVEANLAAAIALAEIGPPALPALEDGLQNSRLNVRIWSANSLGKMGATARPSLSALEAMERQGGDDGKYARDAIEAIRND
ncbi:Hypothetical protein PBC10988_33270 [Planctomycetales bacterium 10988]|nr:Hypothetical protein PBC10988_33270 [Planctomycetales bacterium 10988]